MIYAGRELQVRNR